MQVRCDYCGKKVRKQPSYMTKYNHFFCNRKCFSEYQKEFWVYPKVTKDMTAKNHIKALAIQFQKRRSNAK